MTIDEWVTRTRDRVAVAQGGIPTYYDRRVLRQADEPDPEWQARLARHVAARDSGRFVAWGERAAVAPAGLDPHRGSEIPDHVLIMSQGTGRPLRWRGHDLFKSVFDFALLSVLVAELRPASILEIGSGNGASALWLADLAAMNALDCRVVSVDVHPVSLSHPAVDFVTGDARDLASVLPEDALARGPRLVLEDAHVGVGAVLAYVHDRLAEGDYLVVEDSVGKAAHLAAFTAAHPDVYAVDTQYTDYFGRNATSSVDSILRKMA